MAYETWVQDIFSKGELSPYMYARCTVNEYGNGLKKAQNVLTYPTGAAGKRFGTLYQSTLDSDITSTAGLFFETFQYLNECIYQLVFYPGNIDIYLEGLFVANVSVSLTGSQIDSISTTVLDRYFEYCVLNARPVWLIRAANAGNVISSVNSTTNVLNLTTAVTAGLVLPVQITTSGNLPTTNPQILINVTYFVKYLSTSTAALYATAYDAKFDLNRFVITNNGTGTNTLFPQNSWSVAAPTFKSVPVYDFNGGYNSINFTPTALTGVSVVNLSAPYAPLISATYVGGAFFGNGGVGRITSVASTSQFTIFLERPFNDLTAIPGNLAVLSEPAWSDVRGWPQVCSSYQNRHLLANSRSLPNGFWASAINDYLDFGDLTQDDDDPISWYPSSNNINYIKFIVPYRSITVHTNTGIYSSPLSDVSAITPNNFTLQLQDSTPADVLLPQAIDNQVLVLSGNDAHQMLWDGINNAYTSDIVSVISEQVIRDPVDEVAFADLHRAGSRYVFIINANGTMATFQTLISQNVSGFTPQIMEQSNGSAQFRQAGSSANGRCWFVVEIQIPEANAPIAITAFTTTTLTATGSYPFSLVPVAIKFTTTGTLPASTPALETGTYYWAIWTDAANIFKVYANQEDAAAGVNNFTFTSAGTNSNVIVWPLQTIFTLEELTQETYIDCAFYFNNGNSPSSTINTGALFNTQNVVMVGDDFGFSAQGNNNQVTFEAHGVATEVTEGYIGFAINTIIEPMPLSMANGPSAKNNTLTKPKHIRFINFMFNNTIGGTINGVPIALNRFNQTNIGEPPTPARGVFQMSIMKAWDDFNNPSYTIEHSEPFNIQLLGVFYAVDI